MLFETYKIRIIVVFEQCQLYSEVFEFLFEAMLVKTIEVENRLVRKMHRIFPFKSGIKREREHMYRANVPFFYSRAKR